MTFVKSVKSVFSAVIILFIVGCASTGETGKKRYFWPPFSDEPKIEYVEFIKSDYDIQKNSIGAIEEIIFGRERPKSIFSQPFSIYSNGLGKLFVSEPRERYILVADLSLGVLDRLRDDDGTTYVFKQPAGVSGDSKDSIYVVDSVDKKIFIFGSDYRFKKEIFHDEFVRPLNLAIDEVKEKIYIVDPGQHKVHVLSWPDGLFLFSFDGSGQGGMKFNFPLDIDIDESGHIYVLDSLNARVQVFDSGGHFIRGFGERGTALGSFQIPKGIAISPSEHVYVTDSIANRVVVFDLSGQHLITFGGRFSAKRGQYAPGGFDLPAGIDIDAQDSIWIVDSLNRMVHHYQYLNDDYLLRNPILPEQMLGPGN